MQPLSTEKEESTQKESLQGQEDSTQEEDAPLEVKDSDAMKDDDDDKTQEMDTYFPDPDIDNPPWLESVSWWSEFTSIHGVYYAFERGHFQMWKQWMWTILVLACTAGLITTLVFMIDEFKEYNVNTSVRPIIPKSLEFPQVTVCNTNMYSTYLQNETGITEPTNEEELNAISQPLEDLIRYTSFNGIEQDVDVVWIPIITSFGRCYKFITQERVFKPGSGAGLEFWSWLNQTNYMASTIQAALFVFVTQPGTDLISDQTRQVLVPPGGTAFLGLERTNIQRETEAPWSKCDGTAPSYTNQACRTECINEATRRICQCRQIGDPTTNTSLPYCTSDDYNCSTLEDELLAACDCQTPPCSEQLFSITYSAAKLAERFKARVEVAEDFSADQMSNNFVHVVVNFDSIKYESTTETKSTSFSQLVSDLGGQMGFFMGISLISVVELFGELIGFRLLPRLWGDKRLYGIGQRKNRKELGLVK